MGVFSVIRGVGATQLVSGSLSDGIAPHVAVHSVCPGEEWDSGASCVTILDDSLPEPQHKIFLIKSGTLPTRKLKISFYTKPVFICFNFSGYVA